jgi:hypothetical protein
LAVTVGMGLGVGGVPGHVALPATTRAVSHPHFSLGVVLDHHRVAHLQRTRPFGSRTGRDARGKELGTPARPHLRRPRETLSPTQDGGAPERTPLYGGWCDGPWGAIRNRMGKGSNSPLLPSNDEKRGSRGRPAQAQHNPRVVLPHPGGRGICKRVVRLKQGLTSPWPRSHPGRTLERLWAEEPSGANAGALPGRTLESLTEANARM